MLVSACLIVRNEELTLRRCLESLDDVVDEIIVLDTGSTDGTITIAQEFTSNVYEYEWNNDFAAARNESLKHAHGKYVLVIDGDEFLDSREKTIIRDALKRNKDSGGFYVHVRNYAGSVRNPISNTDMVQLRIFRRGYRYEGSLHEQIIYALMDNNEKITELPLTIHHFGYLNELVEMRNKVQRNLPIARKNWELNPDDIYNRTSLMGEYARAGLFTECVSLGETTLDEIRSKELDPERTHLYVRGLVFLLIALRAVGQGQRAATIAEELVALFPNSVELHQQYADSLMAVDKHRQAIDVLLRCREIGEPSRSWIDLPRGLGSFWAAESLGKSWGSVGDQNLALKWFLTAFYENPSQASVVRVLVYLLRGDERQLFEYIESHIVDEYTYASYVETCVSLGLPNSSVALGRLENKYGSRAGLRARIGLAAKSGYDCLVDEAKKLRDPEVERLVAIYELDHQSLLQAKERLQSLGTVGEDMWRVYEQLGTTVNFEFQISSVLPDLMLMDARNLIARWLPAAVDRNDIWVNVQYSGLRDVLIGADWPGIYGWECEFNARRLFAAKSWNESASWLERGMRFPPTVTKVIVEADLALAHGNVLHAYQVLKSGHEYFTESEILQTIIDDLNAMYTKELMREDQLMNPMDVYRRTAVQTMPFNVQLAQLHERGALLTQIVKELSEAAQVNEMRKNIEEMQNIITFLRASLDPTLEVSQVADQTYAFIYKILVRWFLEPAIDADDYRTVLDFWSSWADTWRKVTLKTASQIRE